MKVIGMGVCEQNIFEVSDIMTEDLCPKIRGGVDDQIFIGEQIADEERGSGAFVERARAQADGALASYDRNPG